MPATSRSQQRLFGMIHAYQAGKLKGRPRKKIKSLANRIDPESVKHFAETKHTELPEKVADTLLGQNLGVVDDMDIPLETDELTAYIREHLEKMAASFK